MEFLKSLDTAETNELKRVALSNIEEWKACAFSSDEEKALVEKMSEEEKIRAFATLINFGTAGLRGKMLPGTSNMNTLTVALATCALGNLVLEAAGESMGVVIACDSRNNSEEFSRLSASILADMGIKVFIFSSLRPTPELSFALRYLGCKAGINVTASHNTKEYNGYKVYWEDGAQLPPTEAEKISSRIPTLDVAKINCPDFDTLVREGRINVIGEEIDEEYLKCVLAQKISPNSNDTLNILYTPLHGAGHLLVPEALYRAGFKNVSKVATQIVPDGNFPTVEKPNPQFIEAFSEGIKVADGADLIIATDPDADRMGVAVQNEDGKFTALSGNEIALVLLDYIIRAKTENGTMPKNPAVVKSLVSSRLAEVMCRENGIEIFNVYTGFKYIGEKIKEFERDSSYSFIFGFEESYGYLVGTYARDKDAVVASLLIAEAAGYYKAQGKNLLDALDAIYKTYGFWGEYWSEAIITSPDFKAESQRRMEAFRTTPPETVAGEKLVEVSDWQSRCKTNVITGEREPIPMPRENMLSYTLESGTRILMRPSGTEPKIKVYYFIASETRESALQQLEKIKNSLGF